MPAPASNFFTAATARGLLPIQISSADPSELGAPRVGSSRTRSAPQSEHRENPSRYSVLQFGQNMASIISSRAEAVCTEVK